VTRFHLVLTLACVTGAAATSGPTSPEKSPSLMIPSAGNAQGAEKAVGTVHPDQVAWLAKYGTYNARQGYWNLLPNPHGC